jgi:hypothetical protein
MGPLYDGAVSRGAGAHEGGGGIDVGLVDVGLGLGQGESATSGGRAGAGHLEEEVDDDQPVLVIPQHAGVAQRRETPRVLRGRLGLDRQGLESRDGTEGLVGPVD